MGGAIFGTTQQLHYPFVDEAVLSSQNASNKKSIVYTLSLKDGFCGVYIRRQVILITDPVTINIANRLLFRTLKT